MRYEVVPTLVRGLDYYTRTTWEFVGPEGGVAEHPSGGGRYDGLAEELGGPHTPGVGFGAGIERLLLALEDAGVEPPAEEGVDVFFVCEEGATGSACSRRLAELRAQASRADADYAGRSRQGPAHAGEPPRRGRRRRRSSADPSADDDLSEVTLA